MIGPISFSKFLAGWVPALALTRVMPDPPFGQLAVVALGGVPVPLVTCTLGLLGVLMSRPLARRGEAQLSWPLFALVSAIMLIVVELWIVETQPGWLFAFVVAIGLGFSGYSVIELMGEQAQGFIRAVFDRVKSTIGARPQSPPQDGDSL